MNIDEQEKYPEKLKEFLKSLEFLETTTDRMNFLIDYSEQFKPVPGEIAIKPYPEEKKVEFCESGAYVWTVKQYDGTFNFYFDVLNPQGVSAKVLSAVFEETLCGEKAENILNVPDDIVNKIFGQNLSMGKNMGLTGILSKIKNDVKKLGKVNE